MSLRVITLLAIPAALSAADLTRPIAPPDLVFEEKNGIVAIEAEHFTEQALAEKRAWHLTTKDQTPDIQPDGDPSSIAGASGGAYLEILPDTRRTHDDKLITGENFSDEPGKAAVLTYRVHFNTPGKYWLWARAFTTTSEDNGLHFGIDGTWPDTAKKWQTVTRNQWHWKSAQRTEKVHVGVPGILTLDVPTAGLHSIHVSMREDGIALDKILLANSRDYTPEGLGPASAVKSGKAPAPFEFVETTAAAAPEAPAETRPLTLSAASFDLQDSGYYLDKGKWLAINPDKQKSAKVSTASPFPAGKYHVTLQAVGESDGSSTYQVSVNGKKIGDHTCPMATDTFEVGPEYHATFRDIALDPGDVIEVASTIASADGKEWSRARWSGLSFTPADAATATAAAAKSAPNTPAASGPAGPALQQPRQPDGDGSVNISGELKQWHKVTLTLDGPFAHELDNAPNPFTDYDLRVTFTHESGEPKYIVPGYFAADGNAGESSADCGTKWRVHFAPDKLGSWNYTISFLTAPMIITGNVDAVGRVQPLNDKSGTFTIAASDKSLPDFRARGRLAYVGKHHLQFQGDKSFFLKAGADAPETLLAYTEFDNTTLHKKKVPLKTWSAHIRDWNKGDPTWKNGKGKGIIGALNYLAGKGMNAVSFLPYNVSGDGDNIWPFVSPTDKFHYDTSKLDQWAVVLGHATAKGLYLHFKLQENEMDDDRLGQSEGGRPVPASLDGGKLGPERMLYCREIIARFGHQLALNWNIGEENTQSTAEIKDMIGYIRSIDPYQHHVVIHTFPNQQDKQYRPLLGYKGLTGASLQNEWNKVHNLTARWIDASAAAGQPWVAANDEQGPANQGVPPDPGYPGKTKGKYTIDDIRKLTLWGNLMAGGAGVEYYFGYQLAQNDLIAEDWRSRDKSWDYARIALDFFRDQKIPFQDMACRDELVGNDKRDNSRFCLAKDGELYLVYLPDGGSTGIKLPAGSFSLAWFNPRSGEMGEPAPLSGDTLNAPDKDDWLAVIRK